MTPPEELKSPADFKEVTDRIESEETRISPPDKIDVLYKMRDGIYRDQSIRFQWDLNTTIESYFRRKGKHHLPYQRDIEYEEEITEDPVSNRKYQLDAFVAVRCGSK